jgi:alpha-galactosidase
MLSMVLWITAILSSAAAAQDAGAPSEAELAEAKAWATARFAERAPGEPGAALPFSFIYSQRKSSEFLGTWKVDRVTGTAGGGVEESTITYTDPATGLQIRCVARQFPGFPVVEWVVYFKNTGPGDTPILSDIRALDSELPLTRDKSAVVHYAKGSQCQLDDFSPLRASLGPNSEAPQAPWVGEGNPLQLKSQSGRSSCGMLPFFNIDCGTQGVIGAVGWTGDWAANIFRTDTGVRMHAGMARTHLKLLPGEEIRSPRIMLLFWKGERMRGHNLLRRFVLAHHAPRIDGKPVRVPVSLCTWGGNFAEKHIAHGQWCKDNRLPVDFLWVDAGWFGKDEAKVGANVFNSNWGALVGDWFPNPGYFPQGLGPVGQRLKDMGLGFLLWLEPERVFQGTTWTREHPEFLRGPVGSNYLFDLGNPAARRALTEHLVRLINEGNISCYRQDFNMDPRPFWDAADAPDRIGMAEIQHISGLYQLWDDLLTRCPGLLIDNCSSGGRRIDLETMSRSIPLWRSDVQCYPGFRGTAMQGQTHGLGLWVPLSAGACDRQETYMFRSALGQGMDLIMYEFEKDNSKHFDLDWLRKMLSELNEVRDYFLGDFYPLIEFSLAEDCWAAWQFDRPDLGAGVVLAFRRSESPFGEATLPLNGLDGAATYAFRDVDTGELVRLSGGACRDQGLRVQIQEKSAARILIYKKQ